MHRLDLDLREEREQGVPNALLRGAELDRVAPLDPTTLRLFERASERRELSPRAVQSLRRVARTVADRGGPWRTVADRGGPWRTVADLDG